MSKAAGLWISNSQPRGLDCDAEIFARTASRLTRIFRELESELPTMPRRVALAHNFDEQLAGLIEARPAAFCFVFGIPSPSILKRCHELGIATIGAATTLAEAPALLG